MRALPCEALLPRRWVRLADGGVTIMKWIAVTARGWRAAGANGCKKQRIVAWRRSGSQRLVCPCIA
jgi:hypothetical protein